MKKKSHTQITTFWQRTIQWIFIIHKISNDDSWIFQLKFSSLFLYASQHSKARMWTKSKQEKKLFFYLKVNSFVSLQHFWNFTWESEFGQLTVWVWSSSMDIILSDIYNPVESFWYPCSRSFKCGVDIECIIIIV